MIIRQALMIHNEEVSYTMHSLLNQQKNSEGVIYVRALSVVVLPLDVDDLQEAVAKLLAR